MESKKYKNKRVDATATELVSGLYCIDKPAITVPAWIIEGSVDWELIEEEKTIVRTSTDGINLCQGDRVWFINEKYLSEGYPLEVSVSKSYHTEERFPESTGHLFFHSKEKATEYVNDRLKKYSLLDVRKAWNNWNNCSNSAPLIKALKELKT